jgi:predicted transcriptional regulator
MLFTCVSQVNSTDRGRDLLEHLRAAEPASVRDRASFVERMGSLYDASFPAAPALGGVTP